MANEADKIDKNDRVRVHSTTDRPEPDVASEAAEAHLGEQLAEGDVATDEVGERLGEDYLRDAITGEQSADRDPRPDVAGGVVTSAREELSNSDDLPDDAEVAPLPTPMREPE